MCGKHHGGVCYRQSGVCYNCGEHGHFAQDYPHPKKFPAKGLDEGKLGLRTQGKVFAMTNKEAEIPPDVITCII